VQIADPNCISALRCGIPIKLGLEVPRVGTSKDKVVIASFASDKVNHDIIGLGCNDEPSVSVASFCSISSSAVFQCQSLPHVLFQRIKCPRLKTLWDEDLCYLWNVETASTVELLDFGKRGGECGWGVFDESVMTASADEEVRDVREDEP
jgi:hypothetical protein